jgi:hypothetical protein
MNDRYLVVVYLTYAVIAVGLTYWLARTLYRSGAVFLEDVFDDRPELAESVNRLLVTGFYMLNLGYAFFLLRANPTNSGVHAIETLAMKLGILLVSLAVVHFCNMYVFYRLRRHGQAAELAPPVKPQATVAYDQPPFAGSQVGPGYPHGNPA